MRWTHNLSSLRQGVRTLSEPAPRVPNPFVRFPTRDYWLMMMPYAPAAPVVRLRRTPLHEAA